MHLGFWLVRAFACIFVLANVSNSAQETTALSEAERPEIEVVQPSRTQSPDFGLPDIALFLRAGRNVPPGLTATRARERERERAAALELLAAEFGSVSETRESWVVALRSILESRAVGGGIWTAAAGVVGELGLYDFDEQLVAGLAPSSSDAIQLAASQALTRLYGSRPSTDVEFRRPFEPSPGTSYLLQLLRDREAQTLSIQRELIAGDVERAVPALSDSDPKVREAAARVLAIIAAEPGADAARLRVALRKALGAEVSPHAFHAELEALLVLSAGLTPDAAPVANLRGFLLLRSGEAPGAFLYTLASGLSRLPWFEGPGRPELNLRAAERNLANVLRRVAADPHGDTDVTSGVLGALEALLSRVEAVAAESQNEDGAWVRGAEARVPLLDLLASPRVPDGVRRRAAETLSRVALAGDVQLLLDVLADEATRPGLKYVVLGTLASLTEELGGNAVRVVERLFDFLEDPDADLRRRSLSFLGSQGFEPYMRTTDLARIVERLEEEPIQELKSQLLALLRKYGGRELLVPLLASASFDELALGASTRVAELAETLALLSAGDPTSVMQSAHRLAKVDDSGSRLARLLRCLQLVADLDESQARALGPENHGQLVAWARTVRASGVLLQDALQDGPQFLNRLVEFHLPAVVTGTTMSEAERTHTRALFLSDLVALGDQERESEALEQFYAALRAAELNSEVLFAARIRRDRARFNLAQGYTSSALDDFSVLHGNSKLSHVLELSDLRTLASLLVQVALESEKTAADVQAFAVLLGLVKRPAWRNELGAVRLRDLTNLADRAIGSGNATNVETVLALLVDLPTDAATPLPAENGEEPGEVPVWDGLDREPALFAALGELKGRLAAASKASDDSN